MEDSPILSQRKVQSHRRVATSLGYAIVWLCDRSFAVHNWLATKLTGRYIESISTEEIHELQFSHVSPSVILVDVRSKAEQAVSIIPGAITSEQYEENTDRYVGRTVVPYCTVGGRSYLYARKLAAAGIPTKNYRDSILGWCRASLPLETADGKTTNFVHPYWMILPFPECYLLSAREAFSGRQEN